MQYKTAGGAAMGREILRTSMLTLICEDFQSVKNDIVVLRILCMLKV